MKKILAILMILALMPLINAYNKPEVIGYEVPTQSWISRIIQGIFQPTQYSAIGVTFNKQEVSRGGYITPRVKLDYGHDCEKYEVTFMFRTDKTGTFGGVHKEVANIPHKTGDRNYYSFANLPTEDFPDSLCGELIYGLAVHRLYYNGAWHMEIAEYTTSLFRLNCETTCEQKKIGSPYCKSNNVEVIQEWQWQDCTSGHFTTVDFCYPDGCSNGKCDEPCPTGKIGSEFCKGKAIYQKYGSGNIGGTCADEDRLVTICGTDQECDGAKCIDIEYCNDGVCNHGETYNTCPSDCENPYFCGDGYCNNDETQSNCCQDCMCQAGYSCINNQCEEIILTCVAGDTKTKDCDNGDIITTYTCINNEWQPTGNECKITPKIPSWVIPAVIGFLIISGLIVLFTTKKKRRKK